MKIAFAVITLTLFSVTFAKNESKSKKQVKRAHDENRNYAGFPSRPSLLSAPGLIGIRLNEAKDLRKPTGQDGFGRQLPAASPISPLPYQIQSGVQSIGSPGSATTDLVGGSFQGGGLELSLGASFGNSGGLVGGNQGPLGGVDINQGGSNGGFVIQGLQGFHPSFQPDSNVPPGTSLGDGPGGLTSDNSGLTGGLGGAYGGGYGIGLGGLIFGGPVGPVFAGNSGLEGGLGTTSDRDYNDSDEVYPPLEKKRPTNSFQFDSIPTRNSGGIRGPGTSLKTGVDNQGFVAQNQFPRQLIRTPSAEQSNFGSNVFKNHDVITPSFLGHTIPKPHDDSSARGEKISTLQKSFGDTGYIAFIFPKKFSRGPNSQNSTRERAAPQTPLSETSTPKTTIITNAVTYSIPQPVPVTINRPFPYIVPVPVQIPVDRPYPVPLPKAYAVQVAKPYGVTVPKPVPVPVPIAEPIPIEVPKHIPIPVAVAVQVPKPYRVDVPVFVRVNDDNGYFGNAGTSSLFRHLHDGSFIQRRKDKVESNLKK